MAKNKLRNLAIVALTAATLLAFLLALGANQVLGRLLALPEDAELADIAALLAGEIDSDSAIVTSRPTSVRLTKSQWTDPVVKRSIFDSSKVGIVPEGGVPTDGGTKSDLKAVLLATMVAEPEDFSSALIAEERGEDGALGYGLGDNLMGEATVVRIEQKRVYIRRNDGSVEYLAMEDGQSIARPSPGGDDDDEQVEQTGDNKFTVDKDLLDEIIANPEQLASKIRVVPHKGSDGSIDGYRLSGIRRGSFFDKLGVKNGDIVHQVNGRDLTSVSAAMDAYQGLQSESSFNFEVTRRNQRQTFEYEVR